MGELSKLPNIGKIVEGQLNAIGITNYDELKKKGSCGAWLMVQSIDTSACIHRLLSFEGAIRGIKKSELPPEIKAELLDFYRTHKL